MLLEDITIEVRDKDLQRVEPILPDYWTDVFLLPQLRRQGRWSMTLPTEIDACVALREPGAGIVVTGPTGVLISGPVDSRVRKQSTRDPRGTIQFSGVDDNVLLADYLAWPDPANDAEAQTVAYDARSGPGETVIRAYVNANIGPGARAERRAVGLLASHLQMQADGGRGGTVYGNARFDQLGPFLEPLGKLADIAYRIVQIDDHLELEFWVPADKTKEIRLDIANDGLTSTEQAIAAPLVTDGFALGQGEGAARQVVAGTNADATEARIAWGRRIERVKDQRNTDVLAELEQAVAEMLVDDGKTRFSTKVTLNDVVDAEYQVDWGLGDRIATVVDGEEIPEIVTGAGIGISKAGVLIGALIGEQQ